MHHIFVSYHRPDDPWVSALVGRLETHGLTPWIDQRDIPVSFPWLAEVNDAIVECDVFVVCESPGQRASGSCAAEEQLAKDAAKRKCVVTVGEDLDRSAASILQARRGVDAIEEARTELAVLARDWDRAHRPKSALVSPRQRRRLERGLRLAPAASEVERRFLRASRIRSRRRAAISTLVATTFVLAIIGQAVFKAARNQVEKQNGAQAQAYTTARAALADSASSAFLGLARVVAFGTNEAAAAAEAVSDAFKYPVPDDAFTVRRAASRFAAGFVGRNVIVISKTGRAWTRRAAARDTRTAAPTWQSAGVDGPRTSIALRHRAGTSEVAILKRGRLWRRVRFTLPVAHLELSPDGRRLAGAAGGAVRIIDVEGGHLRTILRGNVRTLLDVRWSRDGRRMWGLTQGRVVSWPLQDGLTLIDDPHAPLQAVMPSARADAAWVAAADGRLSEVDIHSGRILAERRIPDKVKSAGASPDGTVAAVAGTKHVWIVSLTTGAEPRRLDVPSCATGRPTFRDDELFYLPCLAGPLLAVSVSAARIAQRVAIPFDGAFGARVIPGTSRVLVGDRLGRLYMLDGTRLTQLIRNECGATISRVAVTADGRGVLPVGPGTGSVGCTRIGSMNGNGGWTWNAVIDHASSSYEAGAATFSRTGKSFAIGYSDGTIVLRPSANITPNLIVTSLDGNIRDMITLPNGSILVASNAGQLQRIPWCEMCLSNRHLARAAERRLRRAVAIGLLSKSSTKGPCLGLEPSGTLSSEDCPHSSARPTAAH